MGLFSPVWSPDGQRIAAGLAERDGVHPVVIDADSGAISRLSTLNLSMRFRRRPVLWINETSICCELLADGHLPFALTSERHAAETLTREWRTAWSGADATAKIFSTADKRSDWDWGITTVLNIETGDATPYGEGMARPDPVRAFESREECAYPVPSIPLPEDRGGVRLNGLDLPDRGHRVTVESDNSGTTILWSRQGEDVLLPFDANPYLRDVSAARIRKLTFSIPGQDEAVAHVLLPPDSPPGRPLPCVVWVYPETNVRREAVSQDILNSPCPFNTQLLAAMGYAVLRPDIPLPKVLNETSVTEALTVAVQAAVAAAVESGLIDAGNCHVAGHSRGGWAAMTLLATTRMFRSGIAIAGPTTCSRSLVSLIRAVAWIRSRADRKNSASRVGGSLNRRGGSRNATSGKARFSRSRRWKLRRFSSMAIRISFRWNRPKKCSRPCAISAGPRSCCVSPAKAISSRHRRMCGQCTRKSSHGLSSIASELAEGTRLRSPIQPVCFPVRRKQKGQRIEPLPFSISDGFSLQMTPLTP